MWAALRSLENTAKTRWMISRGCAICILLTALLYGGVSWLAAASAPFNTLPRVHASLYTAHPDLRSASLIHDALAAPSEMATFSSRPDISESELSVPADLSDISSTASLHDGDSSRESAFTRGSPTSRRHSAANLSEGGIPRSQVYRGESSFQQFVRKLGLLPTLRSTRTAQTRPLSRVKVLKPSTSAKDVLDKLPFFPLASSIGLEDTLLPLTVSQQAESELHKGKRSQDEQKETPAPVRASTSASSGREAASLVDRDNIEFQGLGGLTLTLPATGLARQFFASVPFLQPVKQSEEPGKKGAGAQQRGENNLLGELLNAVKKTDSGQQVEVTDSDEGKILEGGEKTAQGPPKQDHREEKPEEKESNQSGSEIYYDGTLSLVGITTKEQRIPSGETQGNQHGKTKAGEAHDEKRRAQEKRDEGQSRLADLFTRTQQRENVRNEHIGLSVDSVTLPPMSETLLSHLETFPFQHTIPPLRILEDSSILLRRPSHILREASVQLKDAQKWKEKGGPKGGDTTHEKGPAGGLEGGKRKDAEAVVERVKVKSPSPAPPALSPTTDTTGLVSSTDVVGSARESPPGSRIKEARTQQQAVTERGVTAESRVTILSKPPLEPVSPESFHKHPRTLGGKLRIAPPAHFEAWPFRSIADHRKRPHAEGTKAHIIGFPFLPSAGLFSIPSFRSSTSGVFGGGGSLTKPFTPVLLDTHETVARYIEPDDADFSGPSTDEEDRPSYSSVWTQRGTATLSRTVTDELTATSADKEVTTTSTGSPRRGKLPPKHREVSDRYALRRRRRRKSERSGGKSPKTAHEKRLVSRFLTKSKEIRSKKPRRHKGKVVTERERKTDCGDREKACGRFARVSTARTTRTTDDTSRTQVKHERRTIKTRTLYTDFVTATSIFARSANVEHTRGRSSRRHIWREFSSRRLPVPIPPEEELVVDEKAREQLGKRADRLTRNPLIERTSTGCLNVMSEILAPGTTIMFEPRPNVPENERFTPLSLVWGNPLGAGANGIVYEVITKTKEGRKERFALKLALNRHEHVCNAWTRDKRGELSREERMIFHEDVQRVCTAEYEMEMKQRRLLSLSQPTPSTFSPKEDVGKLFTQNQVCVPAAVGRVRGLPEFFVCPGGGVAVVNVAGLTPAASCNLYQILEGYDLSNAEKYELTRQVISAMSKLHALGLLHKDLKSENLLVTSQGRVIIADLAGAEPIVFGLTEPVEKFDPGTVTFVAPERAASRLGRPGASGLITMKANAWSLGMMIYEIWCKGRDPFNLETLTDEEVLLRLDDMLRHRYPLSFKICPPVPGSMHKLIKSLLQPNPRHRRVPVYFMWMHPLLRKEKYLNPSQTSSRSTRRS